jgi:hypothetical protein
MIQKHLKSVIWSQVFKLGLGLKEESGHLFVPQELPSIKDDLFDPVCEIWDLKSCLWHDLDVEGTNGCLIPVHETSCFEVRRLWEYVECVYWKLIVRKICYCQHYIAMLASGYRIETCYILCHLYLPQPKLPNSDCPHMLEVVTQDHIMLRSW